jgi:hypothetical protein
MAADVRPPAPVEFTQADTEGRETSLATGRHPRIAPLGSGSHDLRPSGDLSRLRPAGASGSEPSGALELEARLCACGEYLVADPRATYMVRMAVEAHNVGRSHRAWAEGS